MNNLTATQDFQIPKKMKAWVLGDPDEVILTEKPVPEPDRAEVLVRIDAIAVCATDLEIISHGLRSSMEENHSIRILPPGMNTWGRS